MKFSAGWLREWVPAAPDVETLCELFTGAGLEVAAVDAVDAAFANVVVADVVAVRDHPNADQLRVCDVDAGGERLAVVCGAPNARTGMKTALAPVGAKLPGGAVRRVKLRGVESHGMLPSFAELGLGTDDRGVLDIDSAVFGAPEASVGLTAGTDLRRALCLDDDAAVSLDLTPNRGDCLSISGLARELAVLTDAPVQPPAMAPVAPASDAAFPVAVENPAACPRYLGRVIEGVDLTRPTPLWLRERLRRCGLRAIDPAVDVTNYVLLELGQPLHAFDLSRLQGGIVVRDPLPGESLTLLDGATLRFEEVAAAGHAPLIIAHGAGPVALAGVMGGGESAIGADTRDVFLECAYFSPRSVGATARRYGLHTDASHRFERGVDFNLQTQALERATALLTAIAGGRAGPVVAVSDAARLPRRRPVTLRKARLDRLVGEEIPPPVVERALDQLGMAPSAAGAGASRTWSATPPSHRFDIAGEEDLVEEVLRVHGYNTIESRVPVAPLAFADTPSRVLPESAFADLLAQLGYAEVVTFSFVSQRLMAALAPGSRPLHVVNPVSSDHAVMRANLLPGLVTALKRNLARQARRPRLFEMGQCFTRQAEPAPDPPATPPGVVQRTLVGGVLFGPREEHGWAHPREQTDFFDVKGDVERLLALGGWDAAFEAGGGPVLHPLQSATVRVDGAVVGRLGRLHPETEAALQLPAGVFVFELAVEPLGVLRRRQHHAVSRQPLVRRDLALVVAADVAAAALEGVARKTLGERLVDFEIFDLYVGAGVAAGEKSVALGLTLQHPSRTLTATDIDALLRAALEAFQSEFGARLR